MRCGWNRYSRYGASAITPFVVVVREESFIFAAAARW
jgi:hypothetical protein